MQRAQFAARRKKAWLVILALAVACVLPPDARARELVPFPSQQQQIPSPSPAQQSAPPSGGYYLTEFERSISGMDCGQLQTLRAKLSGSQRNAAGRADQEYFAQLIRLVDQSRKARNCPAR